MVFHLFSPHTLVNPSFCHLIAVQLRVRVQIFAKFLLATFSRATGMDYHHILMANQYGLKSTPFQFLNTFIQASHTLFSLIFDIASAI